MEFHVESTDNHVLKVRDGCSNLLAAKLAQLEKIKEDLKQAKEDAMQSWLDSRPLIDELERMQAELEGAKARVFKANTTISELQAHLGTTDMNIKSTKEAEQELRLMINDKNQALHKAQEEMEQLKSKIDQKRRRRSKLKLVLRLKSQTLQTFQLTCEAIQLESEAFSTSAAQALQYINNSEAANIMVQLTQDEYEHLKKEASEQTSLAERKILVSAEKKLAVENSRDSTFRRLQNLYTHNVSRQSNIMGQRIHKETTMDKTGQLYNRVGSQSKHRHLPKDQPKPSTEINKRNPRQQPKNNNYSYLVKKKKSIFFRIKTFIVRNIAKYFK